MVLPHSNVTCYPVDCFQSQEQPCLLRQVVELAAAYQPLEIFHNLSIHTQRAGKIL